MDSTKKSRIRRKKPQEVSDQKEGMKKNTIDLCRLQIQKQLELNQKDGMVEEDMYLNALTEKEFNEQAKYVLKRTIPKYTKSQVDKIIKVIAFTKMNGWFERFEYKDYKCAVELDNRGKWRIYVKPHKEDILPFQVDTREDYYCDNSSRLVLPDYPLGLWWYGDKIGLDDFLGISIFSEYSWEDFFHKRKGSNRRWNIDKEKLVGKQKMKDLCKKLVDALIKYQDKRKLIQQYNALVSMIRNIEYVANMFYKNNRVESIQKLALLLDPISEIKKR